MQIHTVLPEETIYTISELYQVPAERIMKDNNLPQNYNLSVGESLMITYPNQVYLVQEGDTLSGIAEAFHVTEKVLLRNNPFLQDGNKLLPGEELVISYPKKQTIQVIGYAFSHISPRLLSKMLPYLTYLTIINYKVSADGSIADVNDSQLIQVAKEYGVAPILMISSITEQGKGSYATNHVILNSAEVQNILIHNLLDLMLSKGFYGVNLGFQSILSEDLPLYVKFITAVTNTLNEQGFQVFVTLIPSTFGYISGLSIDIPYFSQIGQAANYVILMSYQWSTAYIPTVGQTTVNFLDDYLNYVMKQIPPEKIFLGLTRIAYDWELPYVEGETTGAALTNLDAINLANQTGSVINYDETTKTPYFYYNTSGVEHFVWYKDARTIDALLELVVDNGLKGLSVWNLMYYAPQTWLVINSQYEIESVL